MSSSPRRLSLCWLVLMLLLKAALPLLAASAAQAQGKTLVEVCTLYGVKTVVLDAAGKVLGEASDLGDEHTDKAAPSGEPCVLAAVVAYAAVGREGSSDVLPSSSPDLIPPATAPPRPVLDAAALWAARLHHAPPVLN